MVGTSIQPDSNASAKKKRPLYFTASQGENESVLIECRVASQLVAASLWRILVCDYVIPKTMCVRSTQGAGCEGTSTVSGSRYYLREDHGGRNADSNTSPATWHETSQVIFPGVSVHDLSTWILYYRKR